MSSAKYTVKRTYGQAGQRKFAPLPPSPRTSPSCPSSPISRETDKRESTSSLRKRPLSDLFSNDLPRKRPALKKSSTSEKKAKISSKTATLTQLHFCIEQSILKTCSQCGLSYTRGAPGDESLHKAHCARVKKGMEWGREEEKEREKAISDITVVDEDVPLKDGQRGRIISVKANVGGKLKNKLSAYIKTMNLALSAPDMEESAIRESKAYLFLLRESGSAREKIVGCVLAQHITTAMQIVRREDTCSSDETKANLIHVEGNLYCKPERYPTPMGIPRLFVSSSCRRKGIAQALLTAAAKTFIHGCKLNPTKGEVAFSQPTSMGRTVMEKWGQGGIRIYEE